MKKKNAPVPVAFHGIAIRAVDPDAVARRAAAMLGWPVLRRSRAEIILGDGPELFLRIVRARRGENEGLAELHLAVEELAKSRRKTVPDPLGGDSRTGELMRGVALTLREFKRAPAGAWKKKRRG
ncbi:MAG TPA: hypothetical protein VE007_12560 [Thermoanaerobaculia bacterium]|nr:hypothetical protein [Thermoanaerobaculia bacterium]